MIKSGKLTVFIYKIIPNCYTPWFYVSPGSLRGLPAVHFDERGHIIPEATTHQLWNFKRVAPSQTELSKVKLTISTRFCFK